MKKGHDDTIAAVATGAGGAIAVIRVSGADAAVVCDAVFRATNRQKLSVSEGYTLHYGEIYDPCEGGVVDDVLVSVFRAPKSYTGENSVEISCHGSRYVQQRIMELLMRHGARSAEPGEFTLRAFLNGKLDLSQAEAVADIISSADRASHTIAVNQMRGGYSSEFAALREELLTLVSLLELELDFGEEDVEFADRTRLSVLMNEIGDRIDRLIGSFSYGNALKEGVSVAIVGSPNVGKSTLLNALVKDDRVMVSEIAGTTRDVVEECIVIEGVKFRFLDTAGIRRTDDTLEKMGIERTYSSLKKANVILLIAEADTTSDRTMCNIGNALEMIDITSEQRLCVIVNKIDKASGSGLSREALIESFPRFADMDVGFIPLSAKFGTNTERLIEYLSSLVGRGSVSDGETIVSNVRHYEALMRASDALNRASTGLNQALSSDLLVQHIRETLHYLSEITGEITTDNILENIFSKFCIGK